MKQLSKLIVLAMIIGLSSTMAQARHRHQQHGNSQIGFAKVTNVEPIYKYVKIPYERKNCWNEVQQHNNQPSHAESMIAGGIIGGVIGNKLGRGHRDRHVATAVGTLIGAAIGQNTGQKKHYQQTVVERRCQRITEYTSEQKIIGYRVEYRYKGDYYYTRMDRQPGPRLRVKVKVVPAE